MESSLDVSVSYDRNPQGRMYQSHIFPAGRTLKLFTGRSGMKGNHIDPDRFKAFTKTKEFLRVQLKTKPDLYTQSPTPHLFADLVYHIPCRFRMGHPPYPGTSLLDFRRGTAHVDIDPLTFPPIEQGRGPGQGLGIRANQLVDYLRGNGLPIDIEFFVGASGKQSGGTDHFGKILITPTKAFY
jgi:hypothetical protein